MRTVSTGLVGCAMGVLLAHMGYNVTTFEFWLGMGLMVAYGVLLAWPARK